jgi:glyoxylase-like metal-dependent hydrolase (beta-lactamase superfamily II)
LKIKRIVGGQIESNGYIVSRNGEGECYIIDPGYNGEKYLRELSAAPLKLAGIILTHHHYDHVGGVQKIKSGTGCPVYMHAEDAAVYKGEVEGLLYGGETLLLDGEELRVIHTPGHTRGSICIYSDKSKACFTGDTIFNVDLGRTDLSGGSAAEMCASIHDIASTWSNEVVIYPGHGAPANMKFVRAHNREYLEIMGRLEDYRPWNGEAFIK